MKLFNNAISPCVQIERERDVYLIALKMYNHSTDQVMIMKKMFYKVLSVSSGRAALTRFAQFLYTQVYIHLSIFNCMESGCR